MTINDRINSIIHSNSGINQKKLGTAIGVSPSTVNNWLKLGRSIPAEYIVSIAECLGVSCEYLLTGRKEAGSSKEDAKWLSMIHRLPDEAKPVICDMIDGYLQKKQ